MRAVFVARVDFLWLDRGVVGESDGASKYVSRGDLLQEKRRQELLEELGFVVVRWMWEEAWRPGAALEQRVRRAFERAQHRTLDPRVRFVFR